MSLCCLGGVLRARRKASSARCAISRCFMWSPMSSPSPTSQASDLIEARSMPRSIRASIGEVVLIGSSLEHLVSMALFKISSIPPVHGFAVLGRIGIADRVKKLGLMISAINDPKMMAAAGPVMDTLERWLPARNTLAHGVYCGYQRSTRQYCFQAFGDLVSWDVENVLGSDVRGFSGEQLKLMIRDGHQLEAQIQATFQVRPLRDTLPPLSFAQKPQGRKWRRNNKAV